MHIETLVLDNFKSFGRTTEIPFYEDFTTVSGPNGSGKSNIIDAVLFALGLARSHGIRAEKLTDLIYDPGQEDGGGGPRETTVTVVLNNEDRTLARDQVVAAAGSEDLGDVDAIRIERRVKRTDDNYYSYYYINGRSVNLADVRDLLSQAGVAPEGYNVVMQGDVTGIISMTPGQRREVVDEIAGVAAFDAKKDDALEELEVVRERVDEAALRIDEKAARLDQLADERETALEYRGLRDEKAVHERHLAAAELEEKRDDLAATRDDVEARREDLREARRELDEKQGAVTRLESELEALNREIERKGEDEQLAIRKQIETVTSEIARLEADVENAGERVREAEANRREAFVQLDRKQERLDDLEDEIRDRKLEKASVNSQIVEKEAELEGIQEEIGAIGAEYEELTDELDAHRADVETERSEKHELQREQDRLLDEARRRSNDQAERRVELDAARERLPELDGELDDLDDELAKARHNRAEIETVVADLRAEKAERGEALSTVEDELQAAQAEYAELEAKADRGGGDGSYGRAVTTVLGADQDGVHGTVGQLGGVDGRYATACETAAGGRLANVVVDDDGVGQRCIEYLKARNAGRATFLPITKMQQRSLPPLPDAEGVIDFAYDLVDFDDRYAGVFSYVLGSTLVVDNLDTARELMGDYRLVTLSGDLVERSGAMTGGSTKGARYSFSKTGKGQLERVAERIADLEDDRRSIADEITSIEERLEDARDRKAEAGDAVRAVEADIDRVERERESVVERIDRLEDRLETIEDDRAAVDERMRELEADIAERDETIAAIEDEIARLEAEIDDSRIPELTAAIESTEAEIDDLEGRMDAVDSALNELQLEQRYAEEAVEELTDRIEESQNRKAAAEERIDDLEAEIEEKRDELAEKEAAVADLEDELADLKGEREALREDVRAAETERDGAREASTRVENRVESLVASAERLEDEIADLEGEIDDYDPDEIPDLDEVRAAMDRIGRAMERLEPVNMLAIDEYDAVEADLDDLEDRKATLEAEQEAIRERMERYERQKKDTFMDAFRGIDAEFREIFGRLSEGTGELHLEDEDDPFAGGLTMRAKPGDKPIQRLDAMSGGEKSLTALAFIFAIQRYNPAPFYALDEVDAFLDAANAERVGEMLDELSDHAQFIVVSHRSALLERSERAIGVTMQENNVSSVTGIAITDGGREPGALGAGRTPGARDGGDR